MKTQKSLIQLIKYYGKENNFSSKEYLFKEGEDNFSIFYLETGSISLEKNGSEVVRLYEGEVLGEIGFLKQERKTISAKTLEESKIYTLSDEDYYKLTNEEKISFIKNLTLFVSDRVYKLNDILFLINNIDDSILNFLKENKTSDIDNIFNSFIELSGILILKKEKEDFEKIYGGMIFNDKIENFVDSMLYNNITHKIGKNYIYICSGKYMYLLSGTPKLSKYILENAIIYTESMFEYLGDQVEKIKNQKLLDNINCAE